MISWPLVTTWPTLVMTEDCTRPSIGALQRQMVDHRLGLGELLRDFLGLALGVVELLARSRT